MVHLAVQALAGTATPLGIIPAGTGNDAGAVPRHPAQRPAARGRRGRRARGSAPSTWPGPAARTSSRVLSAGFDAIVNERANRDDLAARADALQPGHARPSCGSSSRCRTPLDLDGESRALDAMMVAVGNGPSFGGGLRITEGASLDDGLLDVVIFHPMTKAEAGPHLPEAVQRHARRHAGVRAPPGPRGHGRRPRHRRRTPTVSGSARCRSPSTAVPRALKVLVAVMTTPSERYARFKRGAADPGADRLPHRCTTSRSTTSRCAPARRWRPGDGVLVAAPTGSGKTLVGEFAVHLALAPGPQVLLHHADQGAVQPEVRRPASAATAPTRSAC